MRLLFVIDDKNYNIDGNGLVRPSCRCIYIKNNLVAMVHSIKYDYYKFPGGGINDNETKIDCLIRETKEEAGLIIKKESIKEFGYVHRIVKSDCEGIDFFLQDNFYYFCDCEEEIQNQNLDDYEEEEKFTLEFVDYKKAIEVNRFVNHGPTNQTMLEREARILEILVSEGHIRK